MYMYQLPMIKVITMYCKHTKNQNKNENCRVNLIGICLCGALNTEGPMLALCSAIVILQFLVTFE